MTDRRLAAASAALLFLSHLAHAQGPLTTAFTYQGELRSGGNPAAGLYDLRFRLYDAPAAGTQLGSTLCADNVALSNGRFTISLDFGAQFAGQQRFLEIDTRQDTGLDCSNSAGFTTLGPRQPLTASPYAGYALATATAATASNATQLNGQSASFYTNAANLTGALPSSGLSGPYTSAVTLSNVSNSFSGSGAGLVNLNASSLSAGTIDPARLPQPLILNGSDTTAVVQGTNSSTGNFAAGVYGLSSATTGATNGLYGRTESPGGNGVYGLANATSGQAWGVYGLSNSPAGLGGYFTGPGDGLWGVTTGATNSAVVGWHQGTNLGYGIYGQTDGTSGDAVAGAALSTSGGTYGGHFEDHSTSGCGVYGAALAASGGTYGGYFQTSSSSGTGAYGYAAAGSGPTSGVYGRSDSSTGIGVYGYAPQAGSSGSFGGYFTSASTAGQGAHCVNTASSGTTYGVVGEVLSAGGYGVYSLGRLAATGTKSFRIDHPADPENKYLLHYCAEGPEPQNIYNGTVILDGAGNAVVELPSYFGKINKDPRYQLTAIGAFAPVYIASEINLDSTNPSFRIGGGVPGLKVSWEVKATRNDLWVQRYGAPVELDKQGAEKGTYQHPELYGLPPDRGLPALVNPVQAVPPPPAKMHAPSLPQ